MCLCSFFLNRSAGDTLTLEIYRKNGNKPSGSLTSDQLTATELHSGNIQQRQLNSPVNQSYHHSSSILMANTSRMPVVSHHQQPSAVAVTSSSAGITASSNSRRVVVESVGHVSRYPNINNVNNTAAQQLGINISNAPPPLKVAFNKSIGGGVLVWMPCLLLAYIFSWFALHIFLFIHFLLFYLFLVLYLFISVENCINAPLYKHRIGRRQHFVLFPFVSCGISVPPCISEHLAVYVFCIQSFGFSLCITFDDANPLYYIDVAFMYTAIPCK